MRDKIKKFIRPATQAELLYDKVVNSIHSSNFTNLELFDTKDRDIETAYLSMLSNPSNSGRYNGLLVAYKRIPYDERIIQEISIGKIRKVTAATSSQPIFANIRPINLRIYECIFIRPPITYSKSPKKSKDGIISRPAKAAELKKTIMTVEALRVDEGYTIMDPVRNLLNSQYELQDMSEEGYNIDAQDLFYRSSKALDNNITTIERTFIVVPILVNNRYYEDELKNKRYPVLTEAYNYHTAKNRKEIKFHVKSNDKTVSLVDAYLVVARPLDSEEDMFMIKLYSKHHTMFSLIMDKMTADELYIELIQNTEINEETKTLLSNAYNYYIKHREHTVSKYINQIPEIKVMQNYGEDIYTNSEGDIIIRKNKFKAEELLLATEEISNNALSVFEGKGKQRRRGNVSMPAGVSPMEHFRRKLRKNKKNIINNIQHLHTIKYAIMKRDPTRTGPLFSTAPNEVMYGLAHEIGVQAYTVINNSIVYDDSKNTLVKHIDLSPPDIRKSTFRKSTGILSTGIETNTLISDNGLSMYPFVIDGICDNGIDITDKNIDSIPLERLASCSVVVVDDRRAILVEYDAITAALHNPWFNTDGRTLSIVGTKKGYTSFEINGVSSSLEELDKQFELSISAMNLSDNGAEEEAGRKASDDDEDIQTDEDTDGVSNTSDSDLSSGIIDEDYCPTPADTDPLIEASLAESSDYQVGSIRTSFITLDPFTVKSIVMGFNGKKVFGYYQHINDFYMRVFIKSIKKKKGYRNTIGTIDYPRPFQLHSTVKQNTDLLTTNTLKHCLDAFISLAYKKYLHFTPSTDKTGSKATTAYDGFNPARYLDYNTEYGKIDPITSNSEETCGFSSTALVWSDNAPNFCLKVNGDFSNQGATSGVRLRNSYITPDWKHR